MKPLVLASMLCSAAVGYSLPTLSSPHHTPQAKPFSMYGVLSYVPPLPPQPITLGPVPADFVMTDVLVGNSNGYDWAGGIVITVNGSPVFCCGVHPVSTGQSTYYVSRSEHLTGGVLIPRGSTVGVQGYTPGSCPITLVGYLL